MKKIQHLFLVTLASVVLCGMPAMRAAENDAQAEITKTAEAFVEAFQKGDAKTVAAFWTPDGDYVDENSRVLKGQKAIEDSFAELFAAKKGLKVRIDVASLRFPAPDLAIEDGTSTVFAPDGTAPSRARYTNVLVKRDGKWLLSSVREAAYSEPSNYEHLRPLGWAIGEWVEEGANAPVGRISFDWVPGQRWLAERRHAGNWLGPGGEGDSLVELRGRWRLWRCRVGEGRHKVDHQVQLHRNRREQGHRH